MEDDVNDDTRILEFLLQDISAFQLTESFRFGKQHKSNYGSFIINKTIATESKSNQEIQSYPKSFKKNLLKYITNEKAIMETPSSVNSKQYNDSIICMDSSDNHPKQERKKPRDFKHKSNLSSDKYPVIRALEPCSVLNNQNNDIQKAKNLKTKKKKSRKNKPFSRGKMF